MIGSRPVTSVANATAMVFILTQGSPPSGMDVEPPPYSLPARHYPHPAIRSCTSASASTLSTSFQSQHRYSLDTKSGKPWVSFTVHSHSPSSNLLPLFYEHDIITGSVFLDLTKPESIRDIDITVSVSTIALSSIVVYAHTMRGKIPWGGNVWYQLQAGATGVGQRLDIFLEKSQTLWSQSSGKLQGHYSWPFLIDLPREVTIATSRNSQTVFSLPPRFSERGSLSHIEYKLTMTVRRGFLAVNST